MNINEYEKVKDLDYLQYCDYLQNKYGMAVCDYMTKTWNKNKKNSRTAEGLYAHHKYEDHAIMLSTKEYAINYPFEWQLAENIIYCDLLEHLYLHILICEYAEKDIDALASEEIVGIGGVINWIAPELNDVYSGWQTKQAWQKTCYDKIINDKDVYLTLLKRFKRTCKNYPCYTPTCLFTSFNEKYGLWSKNNNKNLFAEIKKL